MDKMIDAPPPGDRPRGRMVRWGVGITLAGFVAGGAFAAATMASSSTPTASQPTNTQTANSQAGNAAAGGPGQSDAELNALLSAASTPASTAAAATTTTRKRPGRLGRLRGIGGYYGSLTVQTKTGLHTVAFERGTIQSINGSNVVVRAPNGVTMTWLLVSNTVVRDHGKASTSVLADGQLVFIGGPVVSEARDARLIVVRTPESTPKTPATPAPSASASSPIPSS
jgi:hypothetical protein